VPEQSSHRCRASRDPGQRRGPAARTLQQRPRAGVGPSSGICGGGLETDESGVSCCTDLSEKKFVIQ
jgi:hypothetical protein